MGPPSHFLPRIWPAYLEYARMVHGPVMREICRCDVIRCAVTIDMEMDICAHMY